LQHIFNILKMYIDASVHYTRHNFGCSGNGTYIREIYRAIY